MLMQKQTEIVWIPNKMFEEMTIEADRAFPDETGGVLLGYWAKPYSEIVITRLIGPGPRAIHKRNRFIPDSDYQEEEIARLYKESGYLHVYLGDWHTHPGSTAYLSPKDHRTLAIIAEFPEARMPVPIMAILGGPPWSIKVWKASPIKCGGATLLLRAIPLVVQLYT
jgi:integrative and conjugative element protein (TIGR02256 family)